MDLLAPITIAFLFCLLIYYSSVVLRTKHDSDIRIVWYFYGLTLVISHLIGFWAVWYGAIDGSGTSNGEAGYFIKKLMRASVDINLSMSIILGTLFLVLAPQFISYILSGLIGVAVSPLYISESLSFLIWGTVKTFIIASAVFTTIPVFGAILSWDSFTFKSILAWLLIAVFFCMFSFLILMIYRESDKVFKQAKEFVPQKILSFFNTIHAWLTRHINKSSD